MPFALLRLNSKKSNIIYSVPIQSDSVTPIVVVEKPVKQVRSCGDFKVTINPCIRTDCYPLAVAEDIPAETYGAKVYSKIDLSAPYTQPSVKKSSQDLLTITIHKGLFRESMEFQGQALLFRQSIMNQILMSLEGTACHIDDILLYSKSEI